MNRYAAGDNRAFKEVYPLVAPRLFEFLNRRAGNPALAKDLFQQTLMKMHEARGTYIPGASVMAWLFSIARNLLIDSSRTTARESFKLIDAEAAPPVQNDRPDQEQVVEVTQDLAYLAEVFGALPANQRDAYMLVREEGLTHAEAAEVLGVTLSAVKLRVFRANQALWAAWVARRDRN